MNSKGKIKALRAPSVAPAAFKLGIAACLLLVCAPATASNGLKVIGQGIESIGLGGADLAVARDANAVELNPAGLSQIQNARFDTYLAPFYYTHLKHADINNDERPLDQRLGALAAAAYARKAFRPDVTIGVGFFISGGTGFGYEDLNTAFGTEDEYSVVLGVSKLVFGAAWQANEQLSLGANLGLSYGQLRQKVFPETSNGAAGFYGLRLDGLDGVSVNSRVGVLYKPHPSVTVGVSYTNETEIVLENGTATVNYSDFPAGDLGNVKYGKASVDGFAFPQEFGVGVRWEPSPKWLLVTELNWLDWTGSLRGVNLKASHPDSAAAPSVLLLAQPVNFRDQYVFSLGAAYAWDDKTTLRIGTNLSRNPVPKETLTPVLNVPEDTEFDFGLSHKLGDHWEFGSAVQWQLFKSVKYDSALFGPDSREDFGVVVWHLQLTKRW